MEVQICIRRTQDVQGNADAALPGPPTSPPKGYGYIVIGLRGYVPRPPCGWMGGGVVGGGGVSSS